MSEGVGRERAKAANDLDTPAFQPYWGKPAVRNDRGDRGNVGIIRSPVRASILPDYKIEHCQSFPQIQDWRLWRNRSGGAPVAPLFWRMSAMTDRTSSTG